MLMTRNDAAEKIAAGATLYLAADESILASLPRGNWIGGSIPYFMDSRGGTHSRELVFVKEQDPSVTEVSVRWYTADTLQSIPSDSPENGFSVVILPATSTVHVRYAQEAPDFPGLFFKNIVGWISGVDLADLGKVKPRVFNGLTGESSSEDALVMHASLPPEKSASVGIVNCFKQGAGDSITFPNDGFAVDHCFVNGVQKNLAEYLNALGADTRLPLVADYNGEMVNVSFQNVDVNERKVTLYAPVFAGVEYRLASPVDNYVERFRERIPVDVLNPEFSCNCILNYLYSELEGKKTGKLTGPVTFGEIAYQLLNQTLVYLQISDTRSA